MTATTFTHSAPLAAAPARKGAPKTSNSFFGRVAAAFWLWVDAFAEARVLARAAHERLPFAEW
jgi:hypothetical protein